MARKAWFRDFDGWWYCWVNGRQIKLAKGKRNKADANRRLDQIKAQHPKPTPVYARKLTVADLRDGFLFFSAANHEPDTTDWFRRFLGQFCNRFGTLRPHTITEDLVNAWLNEEKQIKRGEKTQTLRWSSSTKNAAARCLTQLFNWAVNKKRSLIAENPLRDFKKPPMRRRKRILTPEERKLILSAVRDRAFKMYIFALGNTGTRPGMIRKVTAAHFRLPGLWEFEDHKTMEQTGEPMVVYLTPPMVKLCERLMKENPTGPIFRNTRGKPWTRNAVRIRLRNLRVKLGLEPGVCAYAYRHTWITEGLAAGVDIHTMATLASHRSTKMIETHYSHLSKMVDHMRQAAVIANGRAKKRPPGSSPRTAQDPAA